MSFTPSSPSMKPRNVFPQPEDPSQDGPEVRDRASRGRNPTVTGSGDELEAKKQQQFLSRVHHRAVPNNVGNDPAPKAIYSIDSAKATIGEDIMQPADFEVASSSLPRQSPPVEDQFRQAPSEEPEILLQPDTKPISHKQLVIEVKKIYAGLVPVEAKCIDIDDRQLAAAQEKDPQKKTQLKNDQWQSLVALHKQLLHEHHDFFLASQHPSTNPALSLLATKYSMPARMWRHGIHAFLEVLRHRLPESLEYLLAFIYIAYSMIALLYETVSIFEDRWIECLGRVFSEGDLGRYRMAIEYVEPRDREVWNNVARHWYNKAADKEPNIGRLYHHLALLERPFTLEQLSLYTRSLTCVVPFESDREGIMSLFNPILQGGVTVHPRSFEHLFLHAHTILFTSQIPGPTDKFDMTIDELERHDLFDKYITKARTKFKRSRALIAISNIAALFDYSTPTQSLLKARLRLAEKAHALRDSFTLEGNTNLKSDEPMPWYGEITLDSTTRTSRVASIVLGIALNRTTNDNTFPLQMTLLEYLVRLCQDSHQNYGLNEKFAD